MIEFVMAWSLQNWLVSLILGFILIVSIGLIINLFKRYGIYAWYFVIVIAVFMFALSVNSLPYFVAFALGMATAFAEIISKFVDEPLKALKTPHALFYHILNGAIAAFALWLIVINGVTNATLIEQVKNVMAAGLGSMLIMRSKLFNIKVSGEDVSFGPDQIINIYFRFMEAAIDRVRAIDRIKFVKEQLVNKSYEPAKIYSETMLYSSQALDEKKFIGFVEILKSIDAEKNIDEQLKSYRLGFLLLNTMGEDFVRTVFENWKPQWELQARFPQQESSILTRLNPFTSKDESLPYFAYGSSMSHKRFVERLNWTGIDESTITTLLKPSNCVLSDYRVVFNKPDKEGMGNIGLPNLMPEINTKVEGVLYRLPKDVIEFLDKTETGYARKRVTVTEGDKKVEAETYVAEQTVEGLKPNKEYLGLAIAGAEEHKLSNEYIQSLRSLASS